MNARFTKVSGKPDSGIAVGYWVEGHLAGPPTVGHRALLLGSLKTSLNEIFNWFSTTEIKSLNPSDEGLFITTNNSVWRLNEKP